jgi:hypothetical protein
MEAIYEAAKQNRPVAIEISPKANFQRA